MTPFAWGVLIAVLAVDVGGVPWFIVTMIWWAAYSLLGWESKWPFCVGRKSQGDETTRDS